jgi:hypothetical protein
MFEFNSTLGNFIVLDIERDSYLVKIIAMDKVYDALTGKLLEVIIYSDFKVSK